MEGYDNCLIHLPRPDQRLPSLETKPFDCERLPIDGLEYQVAVSDCSASLDAKAIRAGQPDVPISGDRRSGVLLLDGNKIVGGMVIKGFKVHENYTLIVHEDYRGQGWGQRMIERWLRHVKRRKAIVPQNGSPIALRTFLASLNRVYTWAVDSGLFVPPKVREEMETQVETNRLKEIASEVERTGEPIRIRA